MISISLTSGMFPRSFLSDEPRSSFESTSGTSSGGSFHAAFPGEDFSKISPSSWLVWRVALRSGNLFIAPPPEFLLRWYLRQHASVRSRRQLRLPYQSRNVV